MQAPPGPGLRHVLVLTLSSDGRESAQCEICLRTARTEKSIRQLTVGLCSGRRMRAGQVVRDLGEGLRETSGQPHSSPRVLASSSVNGHVLLQLAQYTFCSLCVACASTRRVISLSRPCTLQPASRGAAAWKLRQLLAGVDPATRQYIGVPRSAASQSLGIG